MCCEPKWVLPHERFVFEVDGLLCQPHLVTARGIAAPVGVASSSWKVTHERISGIQSQLLHDSRVGSQGLRAVQPTKKSLSRDCVLDRRLSGVRLRSPCLHV